MIVRALWLILLTVILGGCGFHLRGTGGYEFSLSELRVSAANAYGELQREVERQLRESGVDLEPAGDAALLRILSERTTRRAVATTREISAAEYELRLEVSFDLVAEDETSLIDPTTLFVERIYSFDSNSLVSSREEEALLTEEMRRDIAGQLIRRVDAAVRTYTEPGSE